MKTKVKTLEKVKESFERFNNHKYLDLAVKSKVEKSDEYNDTDEIKSYSKKTIAFLFALILIIEGACLYMLKFIVDDIRDYYDIAIVVIIVIGMIVLFIVLYSGIQEAIIKLKGLKNYRLLSCIDGIVKDGFEEDIVKTEEELSSSVGIAPNINGTTSPVVTTGMSEHTEVKTHYFLTVDVKNEEYTVEVEKETHEKIEPKNKVSLYVTNISEDIEVLA